MHLTYKPTWHLPCALLLVFIPAVMGIALDLPWWITALGSMLLGWKSGQWVARAEVKAMSTQLIFGEAEKAACATLRRLAAEHPVHMPVVLERMKTAQGKRVHMDQMNTQTIGIPMGFLVTFAIETGHPAGMCRHLSMSSIAHRRIPSTAAVWMIAEELGFNGGLSACCVWLEDLQPGQDKAVSINIVQPVSVVSAGRAAHQ